MGAVNTHLILQAINGTAGGAGNNAPMGGERGGRGGQHAPRSRGGLKPPLFDKLPPRPKRMRRAIYRAARPLVAGIHRLMKSRVADVPGEAIKLCRQARSAVLVELETEGTPAHAAARLAADEYKFQIERLRSRLAAKLPKTLESLTKRFVCQVSQVFRRRDFLCHTRC
jgi:hypothetical protein